MGTGMRLKEGKVTQLRLWPGGEVVYRLPFQGTNDAFWEDPSHIQHEPAVSETLGYSKDPCFGGCAI